MTDNGSVKSPRILCVEDDPDLQYLVSTALRGQGFDVYCSYTGAEGYEKATTMRPDMILLDMMLPQLTGPEVLRCLKDDPATRAVPVIVMTAYAGEPDFFESQVLALGAAAYLRKPVRFDELIPLMRRILGIPAGR